MDIIFYIAMFVIAFTILVFVHELGHFTVARRNNVRVSVFSIGLGPEIFGWSDRNGTRWKICWIPIGGYVRFFGDLDATSGRGADDSDLSDADKAVSFHHKRLGQRAAVVAAGPLANLAFAVLLLAALFATLGQPFRPAKVDAIAEGSVADKAGFALGDVIREIDGTTIGRFEELQDIVRNSAGKELHFTVERNGGTVLLTASPAAVKEVNNFGGEHLVGRLGITGMSLEILDRGPLQSVWYATVETGQLMKMMLGYIGQVVIGARPADELGGPLMIAQLSGQAAQAGLASFVNFIALLSINLGLINLFPVPLLDGGHLLYYAFEAARGKPLGERAQEYGFRIGLAAVLTLMIFVTWQDLNRLPVGEFFSKLFS